MRKYVHGLEGAHRLTGVDTDDRDVSIAYSAGVPENESVHLHTGSVMKSTQ